MIGTAILAAIFGFLTNLGLTPLILRLSHRNKWYDLPNEKRKIHTGLIPRMGGTGIFIAFFAAIALTTVYLLLFARDRLPLPFTLRFLPVAIGAALIYLIGLYDDFRNLKALFKASLQICAAVIVAAGGFLIHSLTLPYIGTISLGIFAYPVTVLWIFGLTNAINLIDGLDGLAGGIAAFAAVAMGIIALIQSIPGTAILAFALFGSVAGFLVYNFPPAKIFMGDSGSLLLGFCLSVFPLMGISKASAFGTLIVPITLLTIPILDTATAILRRIRQKRSIISPDKEHIHHKLMGMGFSDRQILWVVYGFSIYLAAVSISSVVLPKETNVYLILVVWVGSLLAYSFLTFAQAKKEKMKSGSAEAESKDSSKHKSGA